MYTDNHWTQPDSSHPAYQSDAAVASEAELAKDREIVGGVWGENLAELVELALDDTEINEIAEAFAKGPDALHALMAARIKPHHTDMLEAHMEEVNQGEH